MSIEPSVCVIIVAWQDTPGLDDCLESLTRQSDRDFSVVVADNGAGLHDRLRPWQQMLTIEHLDLGENRGVSEARNRAVAKTSAALLLFLDDDAIAREDWVGTYRNLFREQPDVAAARGRVVGKSKTIWNDLARAYDLGERRTPAIINTEGNCAVRRADYEAVGGFDAGMYGHEGAELSARLIEARGDVGAIVYEPGAVIEHDYVDGLVGYLKKRYRHGLMVKHLSARTLRDSAARSRRRSPWTVTRIALVPVKIVGVAAEALGALRVQFAG